MNHLITKGFHAFSQTDECIITVAERDIYEGGQVGESRLKGEGRGDGGGSPNTNTPGRLAVDAACSSLHIRYSITPAIRRCLTPQEVGSILLAALPFHINMTINTDTSADGDRAPSTHWTALDNNLLVLGGSTIPACQSSSSFPAAKLSLHILDQRTPDVSKMVSSMNSSSHSKGKGRAKGVGCPPLPPLSSKEGEGLVAMIRSQATILHVTPYSPGGFDELTSVTLLPFFHQATVMVRNYNIAQTKSLPPPQSQSQSQPSSSQSHTATSPDTIRAFWKESYFLDLPESVTCYSLVETVSYDGEGEEEGKRVSTVVPTCCILSSSLNQPHRVDSDGVNAVLLRYLNTSSFVSSFFDGPLKAVGLTQSAKLLPANKFSLETRALLPLSCDAHSHHHTASSFASASASASTSSPAAALTGSSLVFFKRKAERHDLQETGNRSSKKQRVLEPETVADPSLALGTVKNMPSISRNVVGSIKSKIQPLKPKPKALTTPNLLKGTAAKKPSSKATTAPPPPKKKAAGPSAAGSRSVLVPAPGPPPKLSAAPATGGGALVTGGGAAGKVDKAVKVPKAKAPVVEVSESEWARLCASDKLGSVTIPQLKVLLKQHKVSLGGTKAELVEKARKILSVAKTGP